jgi:hypothetical protein
MDHGRRQTILAVGARTNNGAVPTLLAFSIGALPILGAIATI